MKIERLALALAVINVALVLYILAEPRATDAQGAPGVLRGRALEIVDDRGKLRATITVEPANPSLTLPGGKPYPETVLLRLIDPNGRPGVKIGASEYGAGVSFVGEADRTHVILQAEGAASSLTLTNRDGHERIVQP